MDFEDDTTVRGTEDGLRLALSIVRWLSLAKVGQESTHDVVGQQQRPRWT